MRFVFYFSFLCFMIFIGTFYLCFMIQCKCFLQVRKYAPFIVVETSGDKLAGSAGFNTVAG